MQTGPSHSGDLSQDSSTSLLHPTGVLKREVNTPAASGIDPANRTGKSFYRALSMSSVGLEFGISVVLGLLGGRWLDSTIGTMPWFLLVGLLIGFAAGFRGVLHAVSQSDRWAAKEASRG